jgi:hypothetical protein
MEAKENSQKKNIFDKMTTAAEANDPTKEIQLFSTISYQNCR